MGGRVRECQEQLDEIWRLVFCPELRTDFDTCREVLIELPESNSGEGGHDKLLRACCEIHRHGIEGEKARELIDFYNEEFCNPSWSDKELERKLSVAREKVGDDFGKYAKDKKKEDPYDLEIITVKEFLAKDFKREWLVKDICVQGEPLCVGGPQKGLKTTTMFDMAISLATGTEFLGRFEVPEVTPSLIISGESGGGTLQDTIRRIAESKGIEGCDYPLYVGEKLPQLTIQAHLDALRETISSNGIGFAAVDPAYLCTLAVDVSDRSSNVFAMGSILKGVTNIGEETGCTMCMIHHAKKPPFNAPFRQPELTDFTGAGWGEWMRQWMILSFRDKVKSGVFKLWMMVGGAAGHNEMYAVDADQGQPEDPLIGRVWDVTAKTEDEHESEKRLAEAAEREEQFEIDLQIVASLLASGKDYSLSAVTNGTGLKRDTAEAAINRLIDEGRAEESSTGRTTVYRVLRSE